jgi:predicted RNase H-like HicB family nuclease
MAMLRHCPRIQCSQFLSLEQNVPFKDIETVQTLETYQRQALKLAKVAFLGDEEGFAARIPGFRGLIATGQTKKEALAELETALADWIDLALKRGLGLPPVNQTAADLVSAH